MTAIDETVARELAAKLIAFLETGTPPEGLFTAEAFCDFTMPAAAMSVARASPT